SPSRPRTANCTWSAFDAERLRALLLLTMKPRITLITIGVDDLERSLRFYRDGLGLVTDGIVGQEFEYGSVVFFEMKSGLRLALCRARVSPTIRDCRKAREAPPSSCSRTTCLRHRRSMQ